MTQIHNIIKNEKKKKKKKKKSKNQICFRRPWNNKNDTMEKSGAVKNIRRLAFKEKLIIKTK